jgi:DNA-binding response OmpR family regulator
MGNSDRLEELRLPPILLLLSDDEALIELVCRIVKSPWTLTRESSSTETTHRLLTAPNVRLVILDDQTIEEQQRGRLLMQIRQDIPAASLLYVAGRQSDTNEKRARTNGAHYYVSKPVLPERFSYVLQSFLRAQERP